jgi:hypothetical protein
LLLLEASERAVEEWKPTHKMGFFSIKVFKCC